MKLRNLYSQPLCDLSWVIYLRRAVLRGCNGYRRVDPIPHSQFPIPNSPFPSVNYQNPKTFFYLPATVVRAERSLVCSPFTIALLEAMRHQSVSLGAIAQNNGVKYGYTKKPLSELACDNALNWLIQVGILRREVDGQGITDSFRLTPLGHQLIEQYQGKNWRSPSWGDRISDTMIRWLRLPF